MDLTYSFKDVFSQDILDRYTFLETRNAAAVFKASNPDHFKELAEVLSDFKLYDADIIIPGGNRGKIAYRLDKHFEELGWRAVRVTTESKLLGQMKASMNAKTYDVEFMNTSVVNPGFEVDNMKDRVAIDVEWNAKDGNLDRDLAAYRSLYDMGLIDVTTLITRDHAGIRRLAGEDLESPDSYRRLGTSTTTNMAKLEDRMTRGDSGGCPLLGIGMTQTTWAGKGVPRPGEEHTTVDELYEAYLKAKAEREKAKGGKAELSDEEIDEVLESVEEEHTNND
ncbi:BglII/BstYI family type II restriction endonuclease [Arthrobacter sp. AL12]|uniref:BglII/BstYI family type II restriction endonuclease n=1 Tax=Arthrobacter sp. AL12 TaxID=3042241 RepID=UPI00249B0906|nr:BglII/BstYI family type II restriction endonuclease [Arthrobacter sp. AL12]MDI3211777.1 BglII/BstYI family type II restriction endonuclease [Arthrobacter sp. AL12]